MKAPDLLSQRLRTQHVTTAGLGSPEDVVHQLCAVQSQDYPGAKWSIGQRTRSSPGRNSQPSCDEAGSWPRGNEERVPPAPELTRDEGLAELTRRFFAGHAPATLAHFVWWSGLPVADAKRGLAMVCKELTATVLDERTWFGMSRASRASRASAAYLLPEYDEALVGSKDMCVPDLPRARRAARWTDTFLRPVIIGGSRAGTWRRTVAGSSVELQTNLFAALDRTGRHALEAAAERYGRFLNLPVRLEA